MGDASRTWGFRMSLADGLVLAVSVPVTWWCWQHFGSLAWILPLTIGHFFMFCNLFRLHRPKEVLWAGCCIVNVAAWGLLKNLWWPGILLCQTPLTILLIMVEMRGPWYHGVLARRINPRLDDYLQRRI